MATEEQSTPSTDYDYLIKIITIGDSGVGKSALLKSFMGEPFSKHYTSTIGVDFEIKQQSMMGKKVHLQIWDTAGQERFRTITTSYYRSCDAILLVFDVTVRSSFTNIPAWLNDVRQYAKKNVHIMLVANKVDLEPERVVEYKTAKAFADENNIPYIETSAKTNVNIAQAFNAVAMAALQDRLSDKEREENNAAQRQGQNHSNSIHVDQQDKTSSGFCC